MKPAKAMMSFFPVIFPDSSTYIDTLKCDELHCRVCVEISGPILTKSEADVIGKETYLSDLDLDRSVVLGGDESVSSGALSWDVDIHNVTFVVLHLYYSLENYLQLSK